MSNHIHLIISRNKKETLSEIVRDFKKFTSSQIIKSIQEDLKAGAIGCYGYLVAQEKEILTTKVFRYRNKKVILKNYLRMNL